MSQRQIADALGVTQPAVSQQLKAARELGAVDLELLVEAAGPVLTALAAERGCSRLAVFGSLARGRATRDSDVDLLVQAPEGTSTFGFLRFRQLIEEVLGREVDLVLAHIQGWLDRVERIVEWGEDVYLADALLQEAGDSLMMTVGEAANRL